MNLIWMCVVIGVGAIHHKLLIVQYVFEINIF